MDEPIPKECYWVQKHVFLVNIRLTGIIENVKVCRVFF